MVVRDEGEKNEWIDRAETDRRGMLPHAHISYLSHAGPCISTIFKRLVNN